MKRSLALLLFSVPLAAQEEFPTELDWTYYSPYSYCQSAVTSSEAHLRWRPIERAWQYTLWEFRSGILPYGMVLVQFATIPAVPGITPYYVVSGLSPGERTRYYIAWNDIHGANGLQCIFRTLSETPSGQPTTGQPPTLTDTSPSTPSPTPGPSPSPSPSPSPAPAPPVSAAGGGGAVDWLTLILLASALAAIDVCGKRVLRRAAVASLAASR